MRRCCVLTTLATTALIGASIAGALASPAFAAKPASQRHNTHNDATGTPARYASRIYRCNGGRHYTYAGGWGCDYYVYFGLRAATALGRQPFKLRDSSRLAIRASQ